MTYESWLKRVKTNAEKKQDNEIRFQMPGIIFGSNLCRPTTFLDFDYPDEVIEKGDKNLVDNYQGNLRSVLGVDLLNSDPYTQRGV